MADLTPDEIRRRGEIARIEVERRLNQWETLKSTTIPAMREALQTARAYIIEHGPHIVEEAGVLGEIDGALDIAEGRDG